MSSRDGAMLLSIDSVSAGYGSVNAIANITLEAREGEIVSLVGANGAGKSTLLKTISGLLKPRSGSIIFDGVRIDKEAPHRVARRGLVHVAEGRRLFRTQSVRANLELGLYGEHLGPDEHAQRLDDVFTMFPLLHEKERLLAGSLSGGQQQMLAVGQALVRQPRLLMMDEPSLGLAPIIVDEIFRAVIELNQRGVTVLLVEQMVDKALSIADHAYLLRSGHLVADGPAAELRGSDVVRDAYLGTGA